MKKTVGLSAILVLGMIWAVPQQASAEEEYEYSKDEWPLALIDRPLTLAAGMVEFSGDTVRANMASGAIGDPVSLAPDIYYGVSRKFTVGVTHDRGVCLAGDACGNVYNDVGLDLIYGIMYGGSLQVAFRGGASTSDFDPFTLGVDVGIIGRLDLGNLALVFQPTLYEGILEREAREAVLTMPVALQFQINKQSAVFASSGLIGNLTDLGDTYQIPMGAGAMFAINNRFDFGAEFRFTNLLGKRPADPTTGNTPGRTDARELFVRLALRL